MTNRRYLRDATQHQHSSAERSWTQDGRFVHRHDYQGWLHAIWAAHRDLGYPAASTCAGPTGCETEQTRIKALRQDLAIDAGGDTPAAAPSTSWAYGVQYALNGSAIGAATLLKANAIPQAWPVQYLQTMRSYAASGQLGQFFTQLDRVQLILPEAARGAAAVFDAITRTQGRSSVAATTQARS